jgi:hypothetical protein
MLEGVRKEFDSMVPTGEAQDRIKAIRIAFSELADKIEANCPGSREKAVAMTHLETAAMWAIKSITHNGQPAGNHPQAG